jgi:hypothetical protein
MSGSVNPAVLIAAGRMDGPKLPSRAMSSDPFLENGRISANLYQRLSPQSGTGGQTTFESL